MLRVLCVSLCFVICVNSAVITNKIDSSEFLNNAIYNDDLDLRQSETMHRNICTSEICAKESERIVNSLDVSVDPCENFYEFVCGKYMHDTILPEDKFKDSAFSQVQDQIDAQVRTALFTDPQPDEPNAFKLAKMFTKICMDEKMLNEKGTFNELVCAWMTVILSLSLCPPPLSQVFSH